MRNSKKFFLKFHLRSIFTFGVLFTITFVYIILSLLLLVLAEQKGKQSNENSAFKILYIFYNPKKYTAQYEDEIIFNLTDYHFIN